MSAVTQGPPAAGASILWRLALAVGLVLLVAAMWRTSWLCDDAFITFRSVENLVSGHGPVWNVGERVQTYTHPAWFWLVAGVRFVTGECRDSVMVLGMLLSTGALVWLLALGRSVPLAVVVVAAALASRAWLVFATAGVETSLIYLLTAALLAASLRPAGERRLTAVAIVAGLLCCTRYDLVLFAGPLLLSSCRQVPWRRAAALVALAFVPLWCWLAFAAIYYGTIFPVTAYAKLFCHGLPPGELWLQGLRYLLDCLTVDPVTIVVLLVAGAVALRRQPAVSFGFFPRL
jgi:arabinofuranosyltransferase